MRVLKRMATSTLNTIMNCILNTKSNSMHNHTFKLKRINLERIQKWVIKDKEGGFKEIYL